MKIMHTKKANGGNSATLRLLRFYISCCAFNDLRLRYIIYCAVGELNRLVFAKLKCFVLFECCYCFKEIEIFMFMILYTHLAHT